MTHYNYYWPRFFVLALVLAMLVIGCVGSILAGGAPSIMRPEYERCVALLDTLPCATVSAEPAIATTLRLWRSEDVVVVEVFRASPSTDWEQWTTSCYDSDHALVAVDMRLTTRHGNVFVDEHQLYDTDGTVLNTQKTVRDLFTDELRNDDLNSYYYQPPETKPSLTALLKAVFGDGSLANSESVKACLREPQSQP